MRFLKLWLGWTLVFGALIGGFWGAWQLKTGSVPTVSEIAACDRSHNVLRTFYLPYDVSRWWDITASPVLALLLVVLLNCCERVYKSNKHDKSFVDTIPIILVLLAAPVITMAGFVLDAPSTISYFTGIGSCLSVVTVLTTLIALFVSGPQKLGSVFTSRALTTAPMAWAMVAGTIVGLRHGMPVGLAIGAVAGVTSVIGIYIIVIIMVAMYGAFGALESVGALLKHPGKLLANVAYWVLWKPVEVVGYALGVGLLRLAKLTGVPQLVMNSWNYNTESDKDKVRQALAWLVADLPNHIVSANDLTKTLGVSREIAEEVLKEFAKTDCFMTLKTVNAGFDNEDLVATRSYGRLAHDEPEDYEGKPYQFGNDPY